MIAPKVNALSAWLWVIPRSCSSMKSVAACGAGEFVDHSLDEVGGSEDSKEREQEGKEREDREEGLVGEVAGEGHDVVFFHLFVG